MQVSSPLHAFSAASTRRDDTRVHQLPGLREHRARSLAQGVETLDYRIEHNNQVLPCIKVLYLAFIAPLTAETKNFRLVKQI